MQEETVPAARLRFFLIGARLAGLVLALLLSNMHQVAPNLPVVLKDVKSMTAIAIIAYELLAAVASYQASGIIAVFLVLLDLAVGFAMGYWIGYPYVLLGLAVPVLSTLVYFGRGWGITLAGIGGTFFCAVVLVPAISGVADPNNPGSDPRLTIQLLGAQGVFALLLFYLANVALGESQQIEALQAEARQEKDMLYQQIQSKAQEVGQIYAAVGQSQDVLDKMEARIRDLERTKMELEDQLLAAVEDQDRVRHAHAEMEKRYDEQQDRHQNEMRRSRSQWEREYFITQKKLEREMRLLQVYRELTADLGLNETLLALTNQLQSVLPSQSCVIWLVDEVEGHKELFPEVAASPYTDAFRNRVLQLGEEAPGWCAQRKRTLKIDEGQVSVEGQVLSTLTHYERSALVSPLATQQEILGAVYLGRAESGEFTPEEQELLGRICELASLALLNALDYQRRISRGLNDPVTKLYNGLYLEERLREEVNRGRRYTYPVSLVLVDVDGFAKAHAALGDEGAHHVLGEIAELIRQATRETDVPARYEEDDFGVLCVHTDREKAFAIAERIRAGVAAKEFGPATNRQRLTVSVGVAGVPHDATNEEVLKKRAADGLAMARSKGGNKVCYWDG